ncbi:ELWxxDGT repeat protein [Dolichospermum flos-aquae]|uniref:Uncharacterized protein n=1 Tax=Dolichospermum flos-aquae UHCC 0037 TaxID=2590026 RepID=A0ACC7S9Y4_DOLFA|nr:ELWxxDGT repeat protein [Dolichospermum flos-aquae]MTJ45136.1 hypothetical protein [Dolichospermum flos-aquae UHCC 0037]
MTSTPAMNEPYLVSDINATTYSSNPSSFINVGGILYFTANNDANGIELYKADPSTGVVSLIDINAGSGGSSPTNLTNVNGTLYFQAYDPTNSYELWKIGTNGTPTRIDLGTGGSSPNNLTNVNGTLYFVVYTPTGSYKLWKIDPTTGTPSIVDIVSSSGIFSPSNLTNINGVLYFTASTSANGNELWKIDSTTGSPVFLKDIQVGTGSSSPGNLTYSNGKLYFTADNFTQGVELWQTDGTPEGTVLTQDINATTYSSNPSSFINVGGILYFTANNDINGIELYKADLSTGVVSLIDINAGSGSSSPTYLTNVNGTLYFQAYDLTNGYELWKIGTNGTLTPIDINAGTNSSSPTYLTNVNGTLYFIAYTPTNGYNLWKIDPTTGTPSVIDIGSGSGVYDPGNLTNINGILYFTAYTSDTGYELWKLDPANNLPVFISDLYPGANSSSPSNFINSGGTVYFIANNGTNGSELFRIDPTTGNPVLLDIYAGANSSSPNGLIDVNGTLYFKANDGVNGNQLWKIDPTTGNPVRLVVPDLPSGYAVYLDSFTNVNGKLYFRSSFYSNSTYQPLYTIDSTTGNPVTIAGVSQVSSLTNINGVLYFQAYTATNGYELWKIDSTTGNPVVIDIVSGNDSSSPTNLTNVNGTLFFTASNAANGEELWKLDSTGNPVLVKDIYSGSNGSSPSSLFNVNGTLYFTANDGTNGVELWKSDGTTAGTVLAKDINGRTYSSSPNSLIDVNGTLYFKADDGVNGTQLWKIDPTTGNPVRLVVPDLLGNNAVYLDSFTNVGGKLYFKSYSYNNDYTIYQPLYTIDSTTGNPVIVAGVSYVSNLTNINGVLYFQGDTAANGQELWKIDSTTGEPVVIDIVSGSGSSSPTNLTNVNGTLFFTAYNTANGEELWKLDSTGNPVLVKDINPGSGYSSPSNLYNVNGTLYFTANDGTNGVELWKSDGTTAGTVQLEIYPGANSPNITNFLNVGGVLYFTVNNATNGQELWRINSTTGNPEVIDIVSGTGSFSPTYLTNVNGTLYFQAYTPTNGYELWKIDPTTGKPVVIDIVSGSGSSSPGNLTNVNGTLYFTASTSGYYYGYELWKIDPTTGTPSVIDVVSADNSSSPTNLTNVNGTLYFTASTSANGNELWKIDATTGSPVLLKDIQVGGGSSNPGNLTYSNGKLYFTADNFTQGVELWAVDINTVTTVGSVAKTGNEDQTITFSATDFSSIFSSSSGISLATIKIVQLPSNGVLKLATNNVTVNQEIAVADLGSLTFVPNANFNGTAGFTWNGSDGTNYAANPSNVIFTINSVNDVPEIVNPIPDINFYSNTFSNFNISENAFRDVDLGDSLTYSATLADGSPLPSWLTLNNKIFSGTPPISSAGQLEIKVTATDQNNASVTNNFILTVINSAPTSIYLSNKSIPENSANNTLIGTLSSADANANDTHIYTLINDAGGRFALNGNQIIVANGGLLDYETATRHIIRVKTTDSSGLFYEEDITISISNINDGFTGSFSFTAATYSFNESGAAIISLTRTGGSDGEVSVTVTATDGTATASSDYNNSNLPITLTFANGETSKSVTIPIIDDNVYEPTETVNLTLSNPTNGTTLGTEKTAVLNIIDNDINTNLPDLVVSNIVAPINAQSGETINISWTLTNQGNVNASGSWVDYVYLSDDANIGNDQLLGSFTFDGAIAPGVSVERTQSITLPLILSGNQRIIVSTDANNQILEYSGTETNNTTIDDIPIAVTLKTFPNLQVSSVAVPLTAFSSQSTAIQWTVKNVGNGATSSPYWSDAVYLSLDNTFDDTDISLGQANNPSYLNAGDSYTNHLDVTLPRGISGNYYFLVKTDVRNNVFENDKENDNLTVGSPTNVSLTPPPDFQVTNVTIPSQSFSGQSLNLSWTVTNKGIGKNLETVWYDQVFLSTDEVLDADDRNLGTFSQNGILNSNDSYTSSQTVSLPIGISGDYYFFVRTDAGNQVFESVFDGNNTGYKATPTRINLTPPPDLEILSLTLPTQATASRALNFSYQVTNFGSTTTPNYYWTDRFYLSLDNKLDTNTDLLIGDQPHYGSLAPDESYTSNFSYTLPNTLTGNYYLFGITDSNNEVFELNNENNTFLATTPLVITSQPADLVVVSASVPTTGEAGKALRVEWTVRNQGTGDTAVSSWTDRVILSKDAQIGNSDDIVLGSFSRGEILAPNQSYTRSELVTLPIDAIAGYQVFVVTDAGNSVYEATQENNNSSTGQPLTVTRESADLQVTEVSSPSSGQSGKALTVNWTVKNFGSSTTNINYWYDGVYLSTDNQISNDDIFLGNVYRSEALDASGQYSVSRSFNLPNNLQSGNYYTLVRTDALKYVYEGALENNNDKATEGTTAGTGGVTTGGTSVGVTASPDLVMVSVDAPTTAISGQNLTVNWTVRNAGTVETGDRSWYEAFYLSRDQVFDRNSDIYLGYRSYTGNLAAGATYSQTESFRLPQGISGSFYLFAKTDAGNSLYEGTVENNNVAYDPTSVVVSLAQPADLVAGTITIPANGVTGQSASITYTVTNEGSNAVVGNWSDSLYLSKDGQWDINDLFLGQVDNSREVLSGNSYTNTLTASLPGVVPGDYQVIIRSDIRNEIPESNENNNLKATLDKVNVDVERLTLGTPSTWSLAQGQGVYYRFEVGAGETLRLKLDSVSTTAANELYLRYGEVPTRSAFDLGFSEALSPDQEIVVPETQAGTYYVLAYGQTVAESTPSFSIEAKLLDFEIHSLSTKVGGNSGKVTVVISGAKFDSGTTFTLVDKNLGIEIATSRLDLLDSTKAFATFNLKGKKAGSYNLVAKNKDNQTVTLQDSFTVVEGGKANFETDIIAPSAVRPGDIIAITIQYANNGNVDFESPLGLLVSETEAPISFTREGLTNETNLDLVLKAENSPFGVLAPGATGSITFYTKALSSLNSLEFSLSVLDDPTTPLDWSPYIKRFESEFPESFTDPTLTANFWNIFRASVGETVGDLQTNLVAAQQLLLSSLQDAAQSAGTTLSKDNYATVSIEDFYNAAFLTASSYADQPITAQAVNNLNIAPFSESLSDSSFSQEVSKLNLASSEGALSTLSAGDPILNNGLTDHRQTINSKIGKNIDIYFNIWNKGDVKTNETYVIIHGLNSYGGNPGNKFQAAGWMKDMAEAIKVKYQNANINANIILVDWQAAASVLQTDLFPNPLKSQAYWIAAENSQLLGDVVAEYLKEKNYAPGKVTLIGHSLGAQMAGDAGQYYQKYGTTLNRIIALDAAGPSFENTDIKGHVDASDAKQVIGIHSSNWFGYDDPFGHQDLYLNSRMGIGGISYVHPTSIPASIARFFKLEFYQKFNHGYAYEILNSILKNNPIKDESGTNQVLNWNALLNSPYPNNYKKLKKPPQGSVWDFQEQKIAVILDGDSIAENRDPVYIGKFSTYDKNASATDFQYKLIENPENGFEIKNNNELWSTKPFDYETVKLYEIEVETTQTDPSDPKSSPIPYDESVFTIGILDMPGPDDPNDGAGAGGGAGGGADGGGITSASYRSQPYTPLPPKPKPNKRKRIPVVFPRDPNDIIGPTGFGEEKWTSASSTLPYTIRFENISTATAPAQTVTVTHPLDTDLDLRTFRLSSFGWGGLIFDVPANTAFYNQRLDLTATRGYFVDVTAGIDLVKGEAFWTVTTIDPNTGEVTTDALTGFLPPNNADGIGDGFLNYTIKAKRDVTTGTVIDAKATIVFDTEAPIDTPPIFNTLDAGKPTSSVKALPTIVPDTEFLVNWTGNDDANGSALATYTIYVSDNGGEFTPWLDKTTLTEAIYVGKIGHTYAFYSVATDNSGLTEAVPNQADTITSVGSIVDVNHPPTVLQSIADQSTIEDTTFSFTIPANTFTDIDAGDVLSYSATLENGNSLPSWLTFNSTTRTFSGTPTNDHVGNLNVKAIAIDKAGANVSDIFVITVENVNDAPILNSAIADQTAKQGDAFSFQIPTNTFTDIDAGDVLTYSATLENGNALPNWLTFNPTTRTFSGTPTNDNVGNLNIKAIATDKAGANISDIFVITVENVNDAPIVANLIADQNAKQGNAFSFQIPTNTFTDIDAGDVLTYSATLENGNALPSWLTFNSTTRTFSGTPTNDNVGNFNVKAIATDKAGANISDIFVITVENVNDAPIVANLIADQNAKQGNAFSFQIPTNTFTDVDAGDVLTYSATLENGNALPSWLTFNPTIRTFSGTPTNDHVGNLNVKAIATDKAGATVSDIFVITVENVNDAPTLANTIADQTAKQGDAFSFQIPTNTFTDVDAGDVLTYSATLENGDALPSWLTFNPTTRTFSGTPSNDNVGSLNVKVTATDKAGTSANDIFAIAVENVNDAPILSNAIADQTVKVNSTFTFTLPKDTFSDPDAVNPYKNLVIFGDSLSDTGNAYKASGNTFPPSPNYQGRLSNGLIWVDYFAPDLQFTNPSIQNYAFLGANTGVSNTFGQITVPGLLTQIQQFKTVNTNSIGKDGLYVIWAGANDFLNLATDPTQAVTNAVTNISSAITTLAGLGAKEIVVGNLSDLGATPLSIANNNVANARAISIGFNAALTQALTNLEPALNVDLSLVDIFGLSTAFQTNPANYKFTNITQPLITVTTPVNPDQYAFWDDVHPTNRLHQLVTDTFENTLLNDGVIPDLIKYSATLADGSNLPDWLNFNSTTRTFSGTPNIGNVGKLDVKVIATDKAGATVNDIFTLAVNQSTTVGTPGDDKLIATPGSQFDGQNNIVFTGAGKDELDLSTVSSLPNSGSNIVDLGSGDDTIFVNKSDRAFGSDGNDIFDARDGQGNNRMSGGAGDDIFYLGANDRALGGDGKDIFRVSLGGGNLISGGAGADQFWIVNAELPKAANTVLDFQLGTDVIGIQGAVSLGITTSTLQLNQVGADTAIVFNNQTLATLTGIQASSLSLTDSKQFVFA